MWGVVDYESRVLRIAARLEKYPHGVSIRPAGVAVADVCGEDSMKRSRARAGGCDESAVGGQGTNWFINCALPTIVSHDATSL